MKLLSIGIPCYNSASYMAKAIESCLVLGEDVEIIVVDDGSRKDNTLEIGKAYEAEYPGIVKCVHQENGGHGQAVNTGLANATGLYYKVLDSDDWFDKDSLIAVADKLKKLRDAGTVVDMFICNYVYEKISENKQSIIRYTNVLPKDKVFSWNETKSFLPYQNILMHSVIYRRQMLLDCNLILPKHTFYVDNLFVFQPLPHVKTMYYMDQDLYRYYIGREDQSVNEKIMIGRMDQQLRVNKLMIDSCDMNMEDKKCLKYMIKYLTMISTVTTVLCIKSGTAEHMAQKEHLWQYMKETNPQRFDAVTHTLMGGVMQFKTKPGHKVILLIYNTARKLFSFN